MGLWLRERRGPAWKHGWTEQTLASMSPPPMPLLAIFAIIVLLLSISSYIGYKSQMQSAMINFKIFLLLLPLFLIYVAYSVTRYGRLVVFSPRTKTGHARGAGGASPWGVGVALLLILVLLSYHPYFQSKWSPLVGRPSYM